MLLTLTILTLLQSIVFNNADSLTDYQLKIPNRDIIIHATLTDTNSGDIFFLREFISSVNSDVQGKIEINSKADSSEVHYSTDKNNELLVVQETQCDLFTYKSGWDKKLPGITKPLLNLLLLLGPSVIYRIDRAGFLWTSGEADIDVRGTWMNSATASTINKRLKMTHYYKTKVDENVGIAKPNRIVFEGYDPGAPISTVKENLIMDIYLNEEVDYQLTSIVQIPPGIGCPYYLAKGLPLPNLSAHKIQMVVLENVDGPSSSSTKNEYYLDDDEAVMRLLTSSLGIKTDSIYDYNLGLIYVRQEQGCLISPLTSTSPGVNEAGYYSLYNLLWLNKKYLYLGQIDYEQRPGFQVNAWESTEYNVTISSKTYDKVVTTLYFAESKDSDTFTNYILVGSTRNAYRKGSANDFILVESTIRDFYDFKRAVSESEFDKQFQLDDCLQNEGTKLELAFQLSCTGSRCYNLAQEKPDEFKRSFKSIVLNDKKISPLRVSNVDLEFSSGQINVYMTFLPGPKIDEPFRQRSLTISKDFLAKLGPLTAKDEKSCLTLQASIVAPIKSVIYCNKVTSGNCYHLEESSEKIIEDSKGSLCYVWDFPLNNLYRVGHELTLEEIHENMLDKSKYNYLNFYGHSFSINNILDVTQIPEEDTQFPYAISRHSSKLKAGKVTITTVPDVTDFGSCYRACVHSDDNLCESFSFCENGGQFECLVTSLMYDKIDNDTVVDDKCNIYSKNHLYDYYKIKTKRFIFPTSIATQLPLYDCATFCYASDDCYSFQYCNGLCTFAGYYTDSAAEYREDCDIYSPKVSHKYQVTGDKTVVNTFHTEFNLNMEQCAALCNDWKSDDESCRSFNFCPKGRASSLCLLSKYTVQDGETVQVESSGCHNYEESIVKNQKTNQTPKQSSKSVNGGTSSGSAFGIIILFLVGGLIVGLAAPIGYQLFSSLPSLQSIVSFGRSTLNPPNEPQFGWSKQVNDDEDQSRV